MSKQTIASVMEAKRKIAIQNVTDLLWQDKPADHIATVAISGGLTVDRVQELECYVANAQAELAKLDKFDVDKIRAEAISLNAVFETADTDYKKVLAQRNDAARAKDSAAAALHEAQQAYTEVANQVECGDLPADRAPGTVNQILARRKSGEEIHAMEQRLKDLIRLKQDNQDIVNHYTKQVDQAGSRRNNVVSTPGGFVSENDMMKQKLEKHTVDQAAVEKAIAKLEDEIIAAVKSYERLPSPFEIPKTKEQQNG